MSQTEEISRPRSLLSLNLPLALSLLTALIAAGTVTLHLVGAVVHRQYLGHWGINADLFPKSTDWILINGYYGVADSFISFLKAIVGNLLWLATAAVALGLYIFILLTPWIPASGEAPAWILRQPPWRRRLIRQMLLTALFVVTAPLALFLLTVFIAVPAALGETAGKTAAERATLQHKKGCDLSKIPCIELKREGNVIGTGFVLDSSPSHIAIFDTQAQRGRVLALDKLEVVSNRTPKSKEDSAP